MELLKHFDFPESANAKIRDRQLRDAIFAAFDGKCFYTQRPLTTKDMSIDHVIPVARGGPDNVFNYVLSDRQINAKKCAKFDPQAAIAVLSLVRTVYGPKAIKILQDIRTATTGKRRAPAAHKYGPRLPVIVKSFPYLWIDYEITPERLSVLCGLRTSYLQNGGSREFTTADLPRFRKLGILDYFSDHEHKITDHVFTSFSYQYDSKEKGTKSFGGGNLVGSVSVRRNQAGEITELNVSVNASFTYLCQYDETIFKELIMSRILPFNGTVEYEDEETMQQNWSGISYR